MKKKYLGFLAILCFGFTFSQVGIGTTTPNPSSILEITSTDKGILIPRIDLGDLNTALPVNSPEKSLLVWNTDLANLGSQEGFYFWDGNAWIPLFQEGGGGSSGDGWSLVGNADTNPTTNFIGTTDANSLMIRTNNAPQLRITTRGQIETLNTSNSIFLGEGAGAWDYAVATGNIFIGQNADYDDSGASYSIVLGHNARTSSNYSISIGESSDADSQNSISLGRATQSQGNYGIVIGDAAYNSRANGVAIGRSAQNNGENSLAIGTSTYVTGQNAVAVGPSTQVVGDNSAAIGNGIYLANGNTIRLGNANVTTIEGQVPFTSPSDSRFKFNVSKEVPGLEFITRLNPVTYQFDREKYSEYTNQPEIAKNTGQMESGFLAQEVEKAAQEINYEFNGVNRPTSGTGTYTISYATFVVPLVKAVQEQQVQIENQQKEINELKQLVNQLLTQSKSSNSK